MIRSFLLTLTLFTLNLNLLASSEDEFWKAINSGDYQKSASIGEELAQSKFDYLYLTAVSNHMTYDYLTFSGMSEYYKQTVNGDYSSLSKLLSLHYQENNFNSNNLLGIIKNSITEIQLKEAEWYFKKSLQLESNNSIANNYLSMIENTKGNYDQAIKYSKKSIKLNPKYPEPYNNLTFSYYKQGMEQMAIDNLVICMQNCPKNNSSTYINYIQLACEEVVVMNGNSMFGAPGFKEPKVREELIKNLKDHQINFLELIDQFIQYRSFNEAYTLLNSFQPTEAVKPQYLFTKGLLGIFMESESTRDEALNGLVEINAFDQLLELGNFYVENQDFINGQKIYEKAEKLDNSDEQLMKLYSNLGVCYLQTGNYDEAISTMQKALNISPKDDITLTNLGIAFSLKGDNKTAQEYLIKAKNNCSSPHQMQSIEMWLEKTK